jgi:hypothetical protein
MVILACAIACGGTFGTAAEQGKRVVKVDVDGRTYRVRVNGLTAKAGGTAIWTNPDDPTYFPRAKRAIEKASGCAAIDTYTTGNVLIATLDCKITGAARQ